MSDSLSVAVCWWPPGTSPGGRTQAIRGNVRGFAALDGVDVDLWYKPALAEAFPDDEYDLILSPFLDVFFPETDAHVHLQLGGFGPADLNDETVRKVVLNADTVSALDTRLAYHYHERVGLSPGTTAIIPNAPNRDLFPAQDWDHESGQAFIPKVGGPYKAAERVAECAAQTPDVTYYTHTSEQTALPGNIYTAPPVPLSAMPRQYARASAVVNPSQQEGLPNVAFEAFLSARPYIASRRATGELQLLPSDAVDASAFGVDAKWWRDLATDRDFGDHMVVADGSQLPDAVSDVLNDPDGRRAVGERGRAWVEDAFGGYDWETKAERILADAGLR